MPLRADYTELTCFSSLKPKDSTFVVKMSVEMKREVTSAICRVPLDRRSDYCCSRIENTYPCLRIRQAS